MSSFSGGCWLPAGPSGRYRSLPLTRRARFAESYPPLSAPSRAANASLDDDRPQWLRPAITPSVNADQIRPHSPLHRLPWAQEAQTGLLRTGRGWLCRHRPIDLVDEQVKSAFPGTVQNVNMRSFYGVAHGCLDPAQLPSQVIKGPCLPVIRGLKSPTVLAGFR
jgi:hypothetical protein